MIQAISGMGATAYAAPKTRPPQSEVQEPPQVERAEALRGAQETLESSANPNLGTRLSLMA